MANAFLTLDVPAGDGPGTALDVSTYDRVKTFVVDGAFTGDLIVEASARSSGGSFAPVPGLFFQAPGDAPSRTVDFVASRVRVRRNLTLGGGGTPSVTLGVQDNFVTQSFDVPVATPNPGPGASVSVSTTGKAKTFVLSGGDFEGQVIVEGSISGSTWDPILSFPAGATPVQTVEARVQFVRTTSVNFAQAAGEALPVVSLVAQDDGGGAAPGATETLTLPDENLYNQLGGPETVFDNWVINTDDLPASFYVRLSAFVSQLGGIWQVRTGGTRNVADGTIRATITGTGAGYVALSDLSAAIANPGGLLLVKLTGLGGAFPGSDIEGTVIRIGA